MCYNAAAAAKASAIQALRHGILILLIPPLAMFIGIFGLAFRRRNRFNDESFHQLGLDRACDSGQAADSRAASLPSAHAAVTATEEPDGAGHDFESARLVSCAAGVERESNKGL
jgi:hypothetical protein